MLKLNIIMGLVISLEIASKLFGNALENIENILGNLLEIDATLASIKVLRIIG